MIDTSTITPRICFNCINSHELCERIVENKQGTKGRYVQVTEWVMCKHKHQPVKFCEAMCCNAYKEE